MPAPAPGAGCTLSAGLPQPGPPWGLQSWGAYHGGPCSEQAAGQRSLWRVIWSQVSWWSSLGPPATPSSCLGPHRAKSPGPASERPTGRRTLGSASPKGRAQTLPPHAHRAPPAPALCFSKALPALLAPQHLTCGDRTSDEGTEAPPADFRQGFPGMGSAETRGEAHCEQGAARPAGLPAGVGCAAGGARPQPARTHTERCPGISPP